MIDLKKLAKLTEKYVALDKELRAYLAENKPEGKAYQLSATAVQEIRDLKWLADHMRMTICLLQRPRLAERYGKSGRTIEACYRFEHHVGTKKNPPNSASLVYGGDLLKSCLMDNGRV
jgi:hypothetical protein